LEKYSEFGWHALSLRRAWSLRKFATPLEDSGRASLARLNRSVRSPLLSRRTNEAGVLTALMTMAILIALTPQTFAQVDSRLQELEAQRIAVIEKLKPTVVAVFAPGGQGGGSGVLITPDGYALTNFHVVQGLGPVMHCGLADGVLYDAVLVGTDKVGDVALIKLLPKKAGQAFPCATMGDSDKVRAGDWSLAMGNPFLLATDFTPTVTYGLVSGVHRYQYPESSRGMLEYTDCIQVDTSINPGNSGGPLFNMNGELIGINGRISLEKRGRVHSGVGYAISINQIKNFMGHLRAGLEADHATLGAFIQNRTEDGNQAGMVVASILENCDAHRRGLDVNDELISFAGRAITNRNHYQNVLGLFPKGWRVPLVYRRDNDKKEILVRLMGAIRQEIDDGRPRPPEPAPSPTRPKPAQKDSPASKLYEAKAGFANFYFNRQERDRVLEAFAKQGDFSNLKGSWTIDADFEVNKKAARARIVIGDEKDSTGKITRSLVRLTLGGVVFALDPLAVGQDAEQVSAPKDSGGLLMALYQYRRLLVSGVKGFEGQMSHGGTEPFYPQPLQGPPPKSLGELRVDTDVIATEHAGVTAKWYFDKQDSRLLGAEIVSVRDEDPCELYFHDYKPVEGRQLPQRIEVRYGNGRFGILTITNYQTPTL
jgi:serine protease Do